MEFITSLLTFSPSKENRRLRDCGRPLRLILRWELTEMVLPLRSYDPGTLDQYEDNGDDDEYGIGTILLGGMITE